MHKDISSSNILVAGGDATGSQDGVYVIDFGAASAMHEESASQLAADASLVGTLAYISPEQTGRMNRNVDYRTDFYSLGVVLYELLTGRLPFDSRDALELIHDHIARLPRPPHEIESAIPGPVSDIILRLLAKNAEDRYQTARGVQFDLERCFDQWQRKGRIEPFPLGHDDFTGRLQIPQKLYGREAEIERMRSVLDRAFTAQAQLLLVAGYSGVGKTSLVRELLKDITAKYGTYIEGKFDQLQRTRPYSAWGQALAELVDMWLTQSETSIARWRDTILEAVGDQGQALIDVIPVLERVLGPQPEVPQLGGVENQNRIHYLFNRFIACLAPPENPLVVFLDDLQWIDPASLDFIESLYADQSGSRLLVIGAYRSNEVEATHPLAISQDKMRADTQRVTVLELGDLSADDTNHLLADSLSLSVADCRDLGEVLVEKSAGNPFFFRQLLYALEADELLEFDREQRRWSWGEDLGQNIQARGSVVDLMITTLRTLPGDTQGALSMAACVGSHFDATTLHTVLGQPEADVLESLSPALRAGLIVRSDGHFSFGHDRIQEAGYALIPKSDRPRTHLEIGRALLAEAGGQDLGERLFTVVGHLNAGRTSIDTDSERIELAALNLATGQRAKAASAFADAKEYIEVGLELLRTDSWRDHYELTLSLHNERGELAALTGQLDQVQATAALIQANAQRPLDRVRIIMALIEAETMQYNPSRALQIGIEALRGLGIEIPMQPSTEYHQGLRRRLVDLLSTGTAQRWAQQQEMSDETALVASSLLASIMSTSYIVNPPLFPIIAYQGALLTLEFGLDVWSPFFIGGVALVNFSLLHGETPAPEAAEIVQFNRQLIETVRQMLDRPVTARSETKGLMMLAFVVPWMRPLEEGIEFARETYHSGYRTGDTLYGSYGAFHYGMQAFAAGMNLVTYERHLSDYTDSLKRMGQVFTSHLLAIQLQTARNLREAVSDPHRLHGTYFDEDEWLPKALASNDMSGRHVFSICKLLLAYHFDVHDKLDEYGREAESLLAGGRSQFTLPVFYLYFPLSRLRPAGSDAKDESKTLGLVDDYLRLIGLWSECAPSTFQHKWDLIAAEKARVSGDLGGALNHYEAAISGARASGFTHEEALANELYARFWAERDNERFAGPLMREAHSLYRKWGALAKADHLAERYPQWVVRRRLLVPDHEVSLISGDLKVGDLDLRTILKASQDIASEIRLDSLLSRLMTHVIENTGAQQGYLILERDGRWMIEARASVDEPEPFAQTPEDIAGSDLLAEGIVRYVARKQETVVLEDACTSGRFAEHRYVQDHQIRSVLCAPLVNRGKISAILYLENNLAPNVFSPDRVSLLKLLSSQMAISIDNARNHADLEELLESRSRALASAETQVRTLFEDSPLGIVLSSPEGKMLSVNKAVSKMLRITEDELLERSVAEFYDDPSDRNALLRRVAEFGFVQDFGVQLVRDDGSRFHASLNMSKLVLEGNQVLRGMVQDVTAQIKAEQETAAFEERARLARELHDAVSQTILSASLLANTIFDTAEKGGTVKTQELGKLRDILRGALDEMRTLLLEMRAAAMPQKTLGQLLASNAEAAQARTRAKVKLRVTGDRLLPEHVTEHLQRIAQESVNNAIRHAEADVVRVDLVCDPDGVSMRITDDGRGFDVERLPEGHHGLNIMQERAEEIGAVLEVRSEIGKGTDVSLTWS
jgi:PAS domain S-box-containing protein